jgi:hypothetical protein
LTVVAIHQPNYLPWIGYFAKAWHSDVLVLLDTVQFPKRSYVNRVQVKTPRGAAWLSQPVISAGRYFQPIRDVAFAEQEWGQSHLRTLTANYARAPYFQTYVDLLAEVLREPGPRLTACNERLIRVVCDVLGIRARIVLASALDVDTDDPTSRLVRLVQAVGGDTYLSGSGGFSYQDLAVFDAAEVRVMRAPARFPEYPQQWDAFVPGLSIVDLLFNRGPDSQSYLDQPCAEVERFQGTEDSVDNLGSDGLAG